jgi:dolichyl-phosphate-mannose-protein mannosyltransferase
VTQSLPPEVTDPPVQVRRPVTEKDYLLAGGIALVFYLIGLYRLGTPGQQIFDEIYHARTGMEYVYGLELHEWTHPPLAKLFIALSYLVWHVRFNPRDGVWTDSLHYPLRMAFAWRYPSLLFGCGALIALYCLARTMFGRRDVAVAATCLLALDGVFFVESRVAMTNVFTVFFVLLSALGTFRFLRSGRYPHLLLTGLGIALALATRWSTLYVWGLTGLALLWHLTTVLIPRWADEAEERGHSSLLAPLLCWAGMAALAMFVIPVAVYALAYVPNVLEGGGDWRHRLVSWHGDGGGHSWYYLLGLKEGLQHNMWAYHAGIKDKHPYSSPWWSWPLMKRPVWYYYEKDPQGLVRGVWAIGNAAIWWASVPALVGAGYLGWTERNRALGLIALLGLGQWMMWGIEPRSLVFMHYYFESIPFACLALAYLACRLWDTGNVYVRLAVGVYAALAVAWFVFYYPLLSAYPISDAYYGAHLWFRPGWI